jgi:hypothetical protein
MIDKDDICSKKHYFMQIDRTLNSLPCKNIFGACYNLSFNSIKYFNIYIFFK